MTSDNDPDENDGVLTPSAADADSERTEQSSPEAGGPVAFGSRKRFAAVLAAVLAGALVAGGILLGTGGFTDGGGIGSTDIGDSKSAALDNDFSRSEPGDCLQWSPAAASEPSLVDCEDPHRFEVAGELDTAAFPSSEFAENAPWPGPERFASIRDENCPLMVDRHIGGGLDPQGRFAAGLMYPSKAQWERGARVLRCGIEQPGAKGIQEEFTGHVAGLDQSFSWPPGTCVGIDPQTRKPAGEVVNCSAPHAFQTTGIVDLSQRFGASNSGKPYPSVETQNDYLRRICPTQTNKFFGGADKFDKTTLNVQWSVVSEASWLTGSRRVVCYVALPYRGGFATLVGDARKGELLINGEVPTPPDLGPPGRLRGSPVPLPPGYSADSRELPAPGGG